MQILLHHGSRFALSDRDMERSRQIFTMADILVATRNDSRSALDAQIDYLEEKYDGKIYHLSSPSIEISSNDIRKRCSNGSSIHFFLPEDVIDYIERNDLYGSTADRRKA